MNWISVRESLPIIPKEKKNKKYKASKPVLVSHDGEVFEALYRNLKTAEKNPAGRIYGVFYTFCPKCLHRSAPFMPSHWMPLPEPAGEL